MFASKKKLRFLPSVVPATALALSLYAAPAVAQLPFPLPPQPQLPYASQLDPQMAAVLTILQAEAGTPIYKLKATEARQQFSAQSAEKSVARASGAQLSPQPVGSVVDTYIPGLGDQIPVRIYTPKGAGPFPVVVYYHGGGFVISTIDTYDPSVRALVNLSNAIFVSVEYRKAPEHPFPAALEDAFAAYYWTIQNAQKIHGIPSKVAVVGESAGGNLAAEVSLLTRDLHVQQPVRQVLVYPEVDGNLNAASDIEYANAIPLNRPSLVWFNARYLTDPSLAENPLVSPLQANLAGVAPATIISAQIDPLQTQGKQYADKLKAAGVPVDYKLYMGVTHEFFGMGAVIDKAKQAEQQAANDLRASFNN